MEQVEADRCVCSDSGAALTRIRADNRLQQPAHCDLTAVRLTQVCVSLNTRAYTSLLFSVLR